MEVKSENELIARFMGWRPSIDGDGWYAMNLAYYSVLLYDESWDWLMPVVQKAFDTPFGNNFEEWKQRCKKISESLAVASIDGVYAAVIDFIKWYNSTPKEGNKP